MKYIYGELKTIYINMKPYNSIIHSVLIILLILFSAYLLLEISTLKGSFERLITLVNPHNSIPHNFYELRSSNGLDPSTIFTFIAVVFGLFSFLTFQSVKDFFANKIEKIEQIQSEYEQHNISWEHKFIELENNINYQSALGLLDKSKKNTDTSGSIMQKISACENIAKILVKPINENDAFITSLHSLLSLSIGELADKLSSNEEPLIYNTMDFTRLKTKQERISKVVSNKDFQLVNKIFSKVTTEY